MRRMKVAAIGAIVVALVATGCGNDSEADRTAVEETVTKTAQAFSTGDVPNLANLMTDRALLEEFEVSRADFMAMPGEAFAIPVQIFDFGKTDVDGNTATSEVVFTLMDSWLSGATVHLAKEEGVWRVDRGIESEAYNFTLPGVTPVKVEMKDFAYIYDPGDFNSGNVRSFELINSGTQEHEAVLLKIDRDGTTAEIVDIAMNAGDDLPEGFEFIAAASAAPGETTTLAFKDELPPGRYVFMCFFEDETDPGHTHLEHGMVADFTVGA